MLLRLLELQTWTLIFPVIVRWVVKPPFKNRYKLRMKFGELPLAMVVLVDFAIKMVWLTSLISLCLMTITNVCYLVIFDTINNISDPKIVTTLKIVSIVASIVILMWRQFLLVRLNSTNMHQK